MMMNDDEMTNKKEKINECIHSSFYGYIRPTKNLNGSSTLFTASKSRLLRKILK